MSQARTPDEGTDTEAAIRYFIDEYPADHPMAMLARELRHSNRESNS